MSLWVGNYPVYKSPVFRLMLGLHIATMRYNAIRGSFVTLVTKRNASEYGSQQIVSVQDIRVVRGGYF